MADHLGRPEAGPAHKEKALRARRALPRRVRRRDPKRGQARARPTAWAPPSTWASVRHQRPAVACHRRERLPTESSLLERRSKECRWATAAQPKFAQAPAPDRPSSETARAAQWPCPSGKPKRRLQAKLRPRACLATAASWVQSDLERREPPSRKMAERREIGRRVISICSALVKVGRVQAGREPSKAGNASIKLLASHVAAVPDNTNPKRRRGAQPRRPLDCASG